MRLVRGSVEILKNSFPEGLATLVNNSFFLKKKQMLWKSGENSFGFAGI